MTNKIILKRKQDLQDLEIVKQVCSLGDELCLTKNEAGLYVLSGFNVPTEKNLFVIADSATTKTIDYETIVKVTVNDVDGEITISCRTNGVLTDDIDYMCLYVETL